MNEDKITKEITKESVFKKPWVQSLIAMIVIFGVLGGFLFWQVSRGSIFIENSYLDAPVVNLASSSAGTLNALYVSEGQAIRAGDQVALVGSQIISAKEDGIVTSAPNVIGAYFAPGQTVVSFVENKEMKVVGSIEETKGLSDIVSGQVVSFTVDAFPGKTYQGIVERVAPTSNESGIAFSISDSRPVKKFDVTAKFDVASYPELKNGMSAKMTIYKK